MRTTILASIAVILFSASASARFEWPTVNPEGGFCGMAYSADPLACPDGFGCDLSTFAKKGYGICRRLCRDSSDCRSDQHCRSAGEASVCVVTSAGEAAALLRQAHFPDITWYTMTGYMQGTLLNSDRSCWVGFSDINQDYNEVVMTILDGRPYEPQTKELQGFRILVSAAGGYELPTRINSIDSLKDLTITIQNGQKSQTLILEQQNGLVSSVTIQEASQTVTCRLAWR